MSRVMMISADCHAGAPPATYAEYLPRKYREDADRWWMLYARESLTRAGTFFDQEAVAAFNDQVGEAGLFTRVVAPGYEPSDDELMALLTDDSSPFAPRRGEFDPEVRRRELEGDGVAGEVVFPQMAPFGAGLQQYRSRIAPEHNLAGIRAYNRWLADFTSSERARHAGVALINVDDIEVTVQEVRAARESGLWGGVLLPTSTGDHPYYHHPRYEPLWAVCEELEMPLHSHSGWSPDYGDCPGASAMYISEVDMWAHRPFAPLVWSGAFERHPGLKLIFTETGCSWVLEKLRVLEFKADLDIFAHFTKNLSLRPREYFERQCYIGASFMYPHEGVDRHRIGVDKLMYGTDYPHIEGTWPNTMAELRKTFATYDEDEIRAILGGNAAAVYGFDLAALAPIGDAIGPDLSELRSGATGL